MRGTGDEAEVTTVEFENVYGVLPEKLAEVRPGATQYSPLVPGARNLADAPAGSLESLAMLAPPGVVERRAAIAQALRALRPGAPFVVLAPKTKGGSRLGQELTQFGCDFEESSRSHHRICVTTAPGDAEAIDAAIAEGAPRFLEDIGLWSTPGVFSWSHVDPGSALLLEHLPAFSGAGADLGCGLGVLSRAVLTSPKVTHLTMIDLDGRAIEMARRNVTDPRASFVWGDVREASQLTGLNFVVMNPPFHEGGAENQALGQAFIRRAAAALRAGGICWLVANRHMPYETVLAPLFRRVNVVAEARGYKVFQAMK